MRRCASSPFRVSHPFNPSRKLTPCRMRRCASSPFRVRSPTSLGYRQGVALPPVRSSAAAPDVASRCRSAHPRAWGDFSWIRGC
ncbi:hypothetical protein BRADI_5g04850v3 [Brachypodium distachyon]|uniref:Uncharacterized protein n=1 Tax=Brachypodium distachyon TaxID=15368 RepID=A0A0Q3E6X1_BRADI|nr:hypothetical protein BRADI_5g04850v3 [Brachypodium distachyon]